VPGIGDNPFTTPRQGPSWAGVVNSAKFGEIPVFVLCKFIQYISFTNSVVGTLRMKKSSYWSVLLKPSPEKLELLSDILDDRGWWARKFQCRYQFFISLTKHLILLSLNKFGEVKKLNA
jgi:hypothetical protein